MPDAQVPISVDNATPAGPRRRDRSKRVNLALQGGGSHGAFTWGVLDRLLEDERVELDGVTGTSAGALNAIVLAGGLTSGGREKAREDLHSFWTRVGKVGLFSPLKRTWLSKLMGRWRIDDSPGYLMFSLSNLFLSPYQTNPYGLNPLRGILESIVDFKLLHSSSVVKLFISATDVETGKIRVFNNRDICVEAGLASACLPQMFQAVEYQGRHYWDGGYMGNPALWPLFYECGSRDVILVQINPLVRRGVPRTAWEIQDRVNEITFNSSLMREMRAVRFVSRLIETGKLDHNEYRHILMHAVAADEALAELHASSKLSADPEFLQFLFKLGRSTADTWLEKTWDKVGQQSSLDLVESYL